MMENQALSRRAFLHGAFFTALGAVLGVLAAPSVQKLAGGDRSKPGKQAGSSTTSVFQENGIRPSMALSLTMLQEEVAKARQAHPTLPDELAQLGEMNRIHGFMMESDGELLLLGDRDPSLPSIHLDDLGVTLRNAYQVSPTYQGAPGCSIDPQSGTSDPWRIQVVKVFGMPPSAPMAARYISLDYELKKVSAAIVSLGEVPSLYDLTRSAAPLCERPRDQEHRAEATHRFWFYPLYPPPPRFLEDEGMVLILKPVDVQLLTEQAFLDQRGQRTGSAPASPLAERFARLVTQLLAANQLPRRYAQLRNDFRVIEVSRLFHFRHVPAERLHYLLYEYPLPEVPVPTFVGGIRREERGEVVCESRITERQVQARRFLESHERVQRYHYTFRGGVEAKVSLTADDFVPERSGPFADLRRRVRTSRPSVRALLWPIHY